MTAPFGAGRLDSGAERQIASDAAKGEVLSPNATCSNTARVWEPQPS